MNTTMVKPQSTITDCEANTMAKRTIEELRANYRREATETINQLEADVSRYVESPIEELMVWAIINNDPGWFTSGSLPSRFILGGDGDTACMFLTPEHQESLLNAVVLQPVVVAGGRRYRLDIALEVRQGNSMRVYVAVECDGHEFHEKTREQAEADKRRDRDLQSIGWTIARFTGSEIFRDPDAAAKSAIDLAQAQLELRIDAEINAIEREKRGGK